VNYLLNGGIVTLAAAALTHCGYPSLIVLGFTTPTRTDLVSKKSARNQIKVTPEYTDMKELSKSTFIVWVTMSNLL